MILILGAPNMLTNRIADHLKAKSAAVRFFDTLTFPGQTQLMLTDSATGTLTLDGETIPLESIRAVFWSYYGGPGVSQWEAIALQDAEQALMSLFYCLDCLWMNPPQAVFNHQYKGHQQQIARALGLKTPQTLISNDPQTVADFYQHCQGRMIYKNISGSGVPTMADELFISQNCADPKPLQPQIYQEFIDGTDVRVHVVGDRLFPSETPSKHWISKVETIEPQTVALPDDVAEDCLRISQTLDLLCTGLDFRKTAYGEFYFLEANPSPQYPVYEDKNGYPISQTIAEVLLQGVPV